MYRIYKKGNYIFIDDETSGVRAEGLSKDVLVRVKQIDSNDFHFTNVNSFDAGTNGINISEIKKEDGSPYTRQEFEDFYTSATGSSISIDVINGNN